MHLEARWNVVGIVTEKRELTSPKNATWRGYVCRVATVGLTAEVNLTPELFGKVGEGELLKFSGRFELQERFLKLMAEKVEPAGADRKGGAA